jgi:hypothetical protein
VIRPLGARPSLISRSQPELRIDSDQVVLMESGGRGLVLPRSEVAGLRRLTLMSVRRGSLPSIMVLDAGGEAVLRIPGEYDAEVVAAALEVPLEGSYEDRLTWAAGRRLYAEVMPRGETLWLRLGLGLVLLSVGLFGAVTLAHWLRLGT